ncbi:unnamed protein product [Phytomonas sp. Hart1]|nr:unnamed protein product [Phytomonas sp. Hart1]|eukprot:CCW71449.1 unnamed protein product [Phytomonas sp. isolate Hart1]
MTPVTSPAPSRVALAVGAACCHNVCILAEDEVLSLAGLSRSPVIPSILLSAGAEDAEAEPEPGERTGQTRRPSAGPAQALDTPYLRVAKCLHGLLRRAHAEDCAWRGRRPLQMIFGADSILRLDESMVVRARCAPITANRILSQDGAKASFSSGQKPRAKLLLPRATPPSLLYRDIDKAFERLIAPSPPSLAYVGSNTHERILGLFFPPPSCVGLKRDREGVEPRNLKGACSTMTGDSTPGKENFLELRTGRVRDVCLLLHLYGYVLEEAERGFTPLPLIDQHDTVEALERILSATDGDGTVQRLGGSPNVDPLEKDRTSKEEDTAERVHAFLGSCHFCCRFCGGQPPVCIDSVASPEPDNPTQAPTKTDQKCISEPVQSNACPVESAGEVETNINPENENAKEVHDAHSHGSENASCGSNRFCKDLDDEENIGANPIEVNEVNLTPEKSIPAEDDCSDYSSSSEAGANISQQRCPSVITMSFSVREPLNGHRNWCPWKTLFLDVVLMGLRGDDEGNEAKAAPLRWVYMDFSITNSNESGKGDFESVEHSVKLPTLFPGTAFKCAGDHNAGEAEPHNKINDIELNKQDRNTLRFQLVLSEMERLITVWRVSEDIEKRFRYSYLLNPYPDKVQQLSCRRSLTIVEPETTTHTNVSESSSSVAMEAFLSNLQKRSDTGGNNPGADMKGSYRAASLIYWPTMMSKMRSTGSSVGENIFALVSKVLQTLLRAEDSMGMSRSMDGDGTVDGRIGANPITSTKQLPGITSPQLTTLLAEGLMLLRKMSSPVIHPSMSGTADISSKRQDLEKQCADFIARMDRECLTKICHSKSTENGVSGRDRVTLDVLQKLVKPTITLLYHDHLSPANSVEKPSQAPPPLGTLSIEATRAGVGIAVDENDRSNGSVVQTQATVVSDTDSSLGFRNGSSPTGWFWSPTSLEDARGTVEDFLNQLRLQQRRKVTPTAPHEPQKPSTKVSRPLSKFALSDDSTLQHDASDSLASGPYPHTEQLVNALPSSSVHFSKSLESDAHHGVDSSTIIDTQPTVFAVPGSAPVPVNAFSNISSSTEWRESSIFQTETLSSVRGSTAARLPTGAHHPTPTPTPSVDSSILGSTPFQETQSRRGPQVSHRQFPYKQFRRPLPHSSQKQMPFLSHPLPQDSFSFGYPFNTNEFQPSFTPLNKDMYLPRSASVVMGTHKSDGGVFSISDEDPNAAPPAMQDSFSLPHPFPVPHTRMPIFSNPGNEHYYSTPAPYTSGLYSQENQGILDGDPNIATLQSEKQLPSQPRRSRRGGGAVGRRRRMGGRGGNV